jgi:hypothetical protein
LQLFNYPSACEGFLLDSLKILRGNVMERSVVKEQMAKVLASRVGFKRKFPDSIITQERFAFNEVWIEHSWCICKESGCDWDRKKGLYVQPIILISQ